MSALHTSDYAIGTAGLVGSGYFGFRTWRSFAKVIADRERDVVIARQNYANQRDMKIQYADHWNDLAKKGKILNDEKSLLRLAKGVRSGTTLLVVAVIGFAAYVAKGFVDVRREPRH